MPVATRGDTSSKSRTALVTSATDAKRGGNGAAATAAAGGQPQAGSQQQQHQQQVQPAAGQLKGNVGSGSRRGGGGGGSTGDPKCDPKKKEHHKSADDVMGPEPEAAPELRARTAVASQAAKDGETGSLAWSLFTAEQLQELDSLDAGALLPKLAEVLGVSNWKEDLQMNILLNCHFNSYLFAKENKFQALQSSTFLAMMKQTLEKAIEEGWTMAKSTAYFRTLLLNHSGAKPPGAENGPWDIFNQQQGRLIADYATSTLYQHYRLYRHAFTTEQSILKMEKSIKLEVPQIPKPLSEAMTLEDFEFDQMRKAHEAEFEHIAHQSCSNLLEHPEAVIEKTCFSPLDILPHEAVRDIVQRTIKDMVDRVAQDFQRQVEDHRARVTSRLTTVEKAIVHGGRSSIVTAKIKGSSRPNVNEAAGSKNVGTKGKKVAAG